MNPSLIKFFQSVIVLIGLIALVMLIKFPLMEGRAQNQNLFYIYSDPFILYGYATSTLFFFGLDQAVKLLGNANKNKLDSQNAIKAAGIIKYCAITISLLIFTAGLYLKVSYNAQDDPNGVLVVSLVAIIIFSGLAIVFSSLEKKLKQKHLTY